jgi:CubicO group peptidase (beta-lactamase class C family)
MAVRATLWLAMVVAMVTFPACGSARGPAIESTRAPLPASAAPLDLAALDGWIAAQMHKHGLKGVALAVTQGEEIVYLKGYGTAGGGRPMTPQTPMFIGSLTKSFTGLAVAQLADQGLVDVRAPVRTYLPWFAVADEAASAQITVGHLLHHTSGLSDAGFSVVLPEMAGLEEGVRALRSARLTAPVGTRFQYFNMGYSVLALVVETVSGQSYEAYLRQHVLEPLQMTHTYTDPAEAARQGLSQGYSRFFGVAVPARQRSPVYELAAGYLIASAEDLAHYAIALNSGGVYQGNRVLSEAGMRRLFAPVQGYGMGWFIEQGHIYHGGANETFKTFVDLYPERELGIVLLINQGYMLDHFVSAPQLFRGVEALVLGGEPPAGGLSVRVIGWGLLALVLALVVFQARNLYRLRDWRRRAASWPTVKRAGDVALNFIIPTAILIAVFSQVKGFFGDRFNLSYQLLVMFRTLTDISLLMVVGSVPDYVQGVVKLYWLVSGRARR